MRVALLVAPACRLLGVPAPRYVGFPMLRFWLTRLGWRDKLRSLVGTARRVGRRGLWRPIAIAPAPEARDDTADTADHAPAATTPDTDRRAA